MHVPSAAHAKLVVSLPESPCKDHRSNHAIATCQISGTYMIFVLDATSPGLACWRQSYDL